MRRISAVLTLTFLAGCGSGWTSVPPVPETEIPPRKQVQVYHAGAMERWHAVRIAGDSISGIRWLAPIEGDTGRIALPLLGIDSIRVGDPSGDFVKTSAFSVYVALPVALIVVCVITRSCPAGD